jgi:hypothetical protein
LERLATFVPPPRAHMTRYHGVLAPCASWRDHVVPQGVPAAMVEPAGAALPHAHTAGTRAGCDGPSGPSSEPCNKLQAPSAQPLETQTPVSSESTSTPHAQPPSDWRPRPRRLLWAQLLQRVFGVDALACPRCGEQMRLLAVIQEPKATRAILECLGLPSRAPPLAPARRESTEPELDFGELPIFDS